MRIRRFSRPTPSAFRPAVLGTRPMATISLSTTRLCAWPLSSYDGDGVGAVFNRADFHAIVDHQAGVLGQVFVRFGDLLVHSGRKVGHGFQHGDFSAQALPHTLPISRPITPAPITPRRAGTSVAASAPALSSTRTLSLPRPAADAGWTGGDDDVGGFDFTGFRRPSVLLISHFSFWRPTRFAQPCTLATLFF